SVCGSHWPAGGGAGVVGVPCQPDGGGGGAAAGSDAGGVAPSGGVGGALAYLMPETQQVWGTGCVTALFNQQRALGPCTPGFTYVNAAHWGSLMHADWHVSGLGVTRSKPR